jgi:hypothetical protein
MGCSSAATMLVSKALCYMIIIQAYCRGDHVPCVFLFAQWCTQ